MLSQESFLAENQTLGSIEFGIYFRLCFYWRVCCNYFVRREGELLSRHKDVKKISELIYLELTVSWKTQVTILLDVLVCSITVCFSAVLLDYGVPVAI